MVPSREAEHSAERLVDVPHFFVCEVAHVLTEPGHVNCAELFNKDPCGTTFDDRFGAKRCRSSTARCRCDDNDRARQELVRLDDDRESITLLLVAPSFW
jgi:hypothetical protein